MIEETDNFDVKVNVNPNGLEKYIALTINNNLVFIDSMQFMNSSLDVFVEICQRWNFGIYLKNLLAMCYK